MRKYVIVIVILIPIISFSQIDSASFEFEGIIRDYYVFLPQEYSGHDKLPLVFNLHGYTLNAKQQMNYSKMNAVADTAGFIVVYPNAVSTAWNAGIGAIPDHVNDVGFIDALIDTLIAHYSIDQERIYSCGFSLGGFMSHRLACELSYRIAAIGDVAGTIANSLLEGFETMHSMPFIKIHGTNDAIVSYNGEGDWASVQKTLNHWSSFNQCLSSDTISIADMDTLDGCSAQEIRYKNMSDSVLVIFYKILKGGHSWPGGDKTYLQSLSLGPVGYTNMDINASSEILNFFKTLKNPIANIAIGKKLEINANYLHTSEDTLFINAQIYNPDGHDVYSFAILNGINNNIKDSIQLFDDGLHYDNDAGDNVWANAKYLNDFPEDMYTLRLSTHDIFFDKIHLLRDSLYFTNAGPVIWSNYTINQYNDSLYSMKVTLENQANSFTVKNISAVLSTNDNNITQILTGYNPQLFPDTEPGQSVENIGAYGYVFYTKNNPETVEFVLDIYSYKIPYWTDKLTVDLLTELEDELQNIPKEFSLAQNYPNPFNPITTIKYSIPSNTEHNSVLQNVELKVYDILGREVATLVNEEQPLGNYEVEFDGSELTSGIYFYRLHIHPTKSGVYPDEVRAGDFVETKKMVLIK